MKILKKNRVTNQKNGIIKMKNYKVSNLKRKATIYIKDNGFKLIKAFNDQRQWSQKELQSKFIDNQFFIPKLLKMGLLEEDKNNYFFPENGNMNFLRQINKKKN